MMKGSLVKDTLTPGAKVTLTGALLLVIVAVLTIPAVGAYEIDGDTVTFEDSRVYFSATPHTINKDGWVEMEFRSKIYTGDVDVVFGFDTDSSRPLAMERWTGSAWVNFGSDYETMDYDYDGKDRWYLLKDKPVVAGNTYTVRVWVDINEFTSGKYDFAIKPSGETLAQAIANDHFYILDPWWNSTFSRCKNITFTEPGIIARINEPVKINITDLNLSGSGSFPYEIRIVNASCEESGPNIGSIFYYVLDNGIDSINATFLLDSIGQGATKNYSAYYGNMTGVGQEVFEDTITLGSSGDADCDRLDNGLLTMDVCSGVDTNNRNGIRYLIDNFQNENLAHVNYGFLSAFMSDGVSWFTQALSNQIYFHDSSGYKYVCITKTDSGETVYSCFEIWGNSRYFNYYMNMTGHTARTGMLMISPESGGDNTFEYAQNDTKTVITDNTSYTMLKGPYGAKFEGDNYVLGVRSSGVSGAIIYDGSGTTYTGNYDSDKGVIYSTDYPDWRLWYGGNSTNAYVYGQMLDNMVSYSIGDEQINETEETPPEEPPSNVTYNYTCPDALFECADGWTSATCLDDNTLTLVNNCSMEWLVGVDYYLCQTVQTKNVHCEYGCGEGINSYGDECYPAPIISMSTAFIIIMIFIVAIFGIPRAFKKRRGR